MGPSLSSGNGGCVRLAVESGPRTRSLRFELEREKAWSAFSRNFELCLAELVEIQQTMIAALGKPEDEQARRWNDRVPPKHENKRTSGLLEFAYAELQEDGGQIAIKPKFVTSWRVVRFEKISSNEDLLAGEQGTVLREAFQARSARLAAPPADGWTHGRKRALRVFLPVYALEGSQLQNQLGEAATLLEAKGCVYGGINMTAFWVKAFPSGVRKLDLEIFDGAAIQEEKHCSALANVATGVCLQVQCCRPPKTVAFTKSKGRSMDRRGPSAGTPRRASTQSRTAMIGNSPLGREPCSPVSRPGWERGARTQSEQLPLNRGGDGSSPHTKWGRAVPTPHFSVPMRRRMTWRFPLSLRVGRDVCRVLAFLPPRIPELDGDSPHRLESPQRLAPRWLPC